MATTAAASEVLQSTTGKTNFQRLARLLISGGTASLWEVFDQLCPPSNLPTKLKNPATVKQLKAAKLTKPQWDCLYPSPGVYGKSTDFDINLLFKLLRNICGLAPPSTGWDALPGSTDHSLQAELVRVKYYRNTVYGHVDYKMEITDDEFPSLWKDISDALLGIAGHMGPVKKNEWQKAIDELLTTSLTEEDERNVQELLKWYKTDEDVKNFLEDLKNVTQEGIILLDTTIKNATIRLEENTEAVAESVHCLETVVLDQVKDMNSHLGGKMESTSKEFEERFDHLQKSVNNIQDTVEEKAELIAVRFEAGLEKVVQVFFGGLFFWAILNILTAVFVEPMKKCYLKVMQDTRRHLEEKMESKSKEVQERIKRLESRSEETHEDIERLAKGVNNIQGTLDGKVELIAGSNEGSETVVTEQAKEMASHSQEKTKRMEEKTKIIADSVQSLEMVVQEQAQETTSHLEDKMESTSKEVEARSDHLQKCVSDVQDSFEEKAEALQSRKGGELTEWSLLWFLFYRLQEDLPE